MLVVPDESHTKTQPLNKIITKTFDKGVGIRRIEVLQWLSENLHTAIFPVTSTEPTVEEAREQRTDIENIRENHQTLGSFGDASSSESDLSVTAPAEVTPTESDQLQGAIREASKDVLPSTYHIADCAVDLWPLQQAVRPAYRLAVRKNSDYLPQAKRRPHAITALFRELRDADAAFLLQTIIEQASSQNTFTLSQRLVVYPKNYGLVTEHDFGRVITDGPQFSLSEAYNDGGHNRFLDSRSFDATEFFTVSERDDGSYQVRERTKHGETAADKARRLLRGHDECRDLYPGYHDTLTDFKRLFRDREYHTKIPVDAAALGAFLSLAPFSLPDSPFNAIGYADEPKTYESRVQVRSTDIETDSPTYQTQGGKIHRDREDRVETSFEHAGWTVSRPDTETTGAVPDLTISKNEITQNVEVEDENLSQPANIIKNAIRGLHQDRDVIFIVGSKSDAQSVVSTLAHPMRETTANGAWLLTQSTELTLDDGGTPHLPESDRTGTSRWETTWNGRLKLLSNGEIIASGPVDEPVSSYEYDTDVIDGSSPSDRTAVHPPMYPPKLCLLSHVEVRYEVDTHTFAKLQPDDYDNDWNTSDQEGRRKRYRNALETFWEQKFVSVPRSRLRDGRDGTTLAPKEVSKQELFDRFRDEFYDPQCSRKTPGDGECGIAMPTPPGDDESYFSEWNDNERGINYEFLAEHTFAWETGVMSSDLPFVDETYRL
jgi:hypothetical protein